MHKTVCLTFLSLATTLVAVPLTRAQQTELGDNSSVELVDPKVLRV